VRRGDPCPRANGDGRASRGARAHVPRRRSARDGAARARRGGPVRCVRRRSDPRRCLGPGARTRCSLRSSTRTPRS
jgi:hypothetical protein